jgi:hypothetical protein
VRLRLLSLVVLTLALAAQPVEAAWTPPPGAVPTLTSLGGGGKNALRSPRIVDIRAIAKRAPTPTLPSKGGGRVLGPARAFPGAGGIYTATSGPNAVEASSPVIELNLGDNYALYGNDQLVEPPDAQIAASPTQLVEVAGATMAILGSDGSLQWTVDLHAMFLLAPTSDFAAPSLQYDYSSSRWFLGGAGNDFGTGSARLFLAVSRTANPFGPWSVTVTDSRDDCPPGGASCLNYLFFLHESIAVTTDKVVQSVQTFNCQGGCNSSGMGYFLVMRKDQLLAAVQPSIDRFFPATFQSNFIAVQMQSNFYVAYVVWLKIGAGSTPDRLGLLQIDGLPSGNPQFQNSGTTTVWEKDFYMSAPMPNITTYPSQPGGSLYASRMPITSAVYRGSDVYGQGQVDLAINDNCASNICIRLIKVSNFGGATVVARDGQFPSWSNTAVNSEAPDLEKTIGLGGANLFDGSLAIDPFGDLFLSAAYSSPTRNPGIAVTGMRAPVSSSSTFMPVSPIAESPSSYGCGAGSNNPWGGYSRAVPDPNNWTHVWMPGEVALASCDWATVITSATMGVGPQATGLRPTYGSTRGGQVIEINGSYFVPNANQVLFGSNAGTILAESPTAIIVSAPAGVAGPVAVTVQTPDGTASAGTFTYITPGQLSPPPAWSSGFHSR